MAISIGWEKVLKSITGAAVGSVLLMFMEPRLDGRMMASGTVSPPSQAISATAVWEDEYID